MKTKLHYILGIASLAVITLNSCDKIETTERTVIVTTMHSPTNPYHLDLGLNTLQSEANWDTTGEIIHAINAQSGDLLLYYMSTAIPGAEIAVTVDGQLALQLTLTGDGPKTVGGSLLIE